MQLRRHGCDLYESCCVRWNAKPNEAIRQQIDRPDLLNLSVIDATNNFLGIPGTHALLDFVVQHRCVEELLLPKNGLDVDCVRHLCEVLQLGGHPRLRRLDVSHNDLTVPGVRLLWQTACAVPTLTKISVDGCGVPEDWVERLERTTAANAALQQHGFFPFGPPREPAGSWQTAFLLLLGASAHVSRYTGSILPVVASYAARLRVRVAPLVVRPDDTREQVEQKLRRCQESHGNDGRTWCTVLVDADCPLNAREQYALKQILTEGPLPPPQPLHDKQGHQRPPVHRLAQTLFVYYANPANRSSEVGDGVEALAPPKWLRMVGLGAPNADAPGQEVDLQVYGELVRQPACVLSEASYEVRCQSDLLVALQTVYTEQPTDKRSANHREEALQPTREDINGTLPFEALLPRVCAEVRSYVEWSEDTAIASHDRVNVPLILYGCSNAGKSAVLSYVIKSCTAPGDDSEQPPRVVQIDVGCGHTSLVILLMRLLTVFTAGNSAHRCRAPYNSMKELSAAVRASVGAYAGPPLTVLLPSFEAIDTCGLPPSAAVEWLPASLSGQVKVVLTVTTESPLLATLRQRAPQPREVLVGPFSEDGRLTVFRHYLAQRHVRLPGLTESDAAVFSSTATPADGEDRTDVEAAYLAKDGATSLLYARLAAACARAALAPGGGVRRPGGDPLGWATEFVDEQLPRTVEEAVVAIAEAAAAMSAAETVRCVLACLCTAPLAVPDLQFICEGLGKCAPQSTVPVLLHLVDAGLVEWRPDSTVYVSEAAARAAVAQRYCGEECMERCGVMVEAHLYRLVTTCSPEAVDAFRYLIPLMVSGGNASLASHLLLSNTPVMDSLLHGDAGNAINPSTGGGIAPNRLYILDALFRLIAARELLLQLSSTAEESSEDAGILAPWALNQEALQRALVDIQLFRDEEAPDSGSASGGTGRSGSFADDLFQCAAWQDGRSPFAVDARSRCGRPPYPILTLTNAGAEDQATAWLNCEGNACSFIHCCPPSSAGSNGPGHVAATTADSVYLFELESDATAKTRTKIEPIAKFHRPFEDVSESLVAALAAADRRVFVLSATSVLLWDFAANTSAIVADAVVDAGSSCMNAFGTQVIAKQPRTFESTGKSSGGGGGGPTSQHSTYCIIDITRRHVVRRLPRRTNGVIHAAVFCGNNPVAYEGNVLYRFSNETEPCGEATALFVGSPPPLEMVHDGVLECVASNEDGRLIATSTGAVLWVWMATTGELLHRIETGHSGITALRFNRSGSQLLCRQPEGLYLWRTATGTCVAPVSNPFATRDCRGGPAAVTTHPFMAHMSAASFFEDGTKMLACVDHHAVVWDTVSTNVVGVVSPAQGLISALCERQGCLYVASTISGDVQLFTSPLPSLQETVAGWPLTTNFLTNAKVSAEAIQEISVDPTAAVVACLDTVGHLRVFSLRTGKPIAWNGTGDDDATISVKSAILVDEDTLLYLPAEPDRQLPSSAVYAVSLGSGVAAPPCLLPRELVYCTETEAQPHLQLRAAEEQGARFAGVEYSYRGHSRLIVLALDNEGPARCRLHCQLVGHSGDMLRSFFFGSFAFTVGAEDRYVRLWSLLEQHMGTERAGYHHPCAIRAATMEVSAPGLLLLLDATGELHRVCVGGIASASRASFLVETVQLSSLRRWALSCGSVTGVAALAPSLLCLQGANGAVALTSATQERRVTQVRPNSQCKVLAACNLREHACVLLGLADGRTLLCRVQQPHTPSGARPRPAQVS